MYTAEEVIKSIEKSYPMEKQAELKNSSDLDIGANIRHVNQYIIGVTPTDQHNSGNYDNFKYSIAKKLSVLNTDIKCLGWRFGDDEINELKSELGKLSEYFEAKLDIEKMISGLNIKGISEAYYYLVVTVVPIKMIYVE